MPRRQTHAHRDVAKVAQEAANELFDTVMSNNLVYEAWKAKHPGASAQGLRKAFVRDNWAKCLPLARATMARMLSEPIDDRLKESIVEALALDQTLMLGRERRVAEVQ